MDFKNEMIEAYVIMVDEGHADFTDEWVVMESF